MRCRYNWLALAVSPPAVPGRHRADFNARRLVAPMPIGRPPRWLLLPAPEPKQACRITTGPAAKERRADPARWPSGVVTAHKSADATAIRARGRTPTWDICIRGIAIVSAGDARPLVRRRRDRQRGDCLDDRSDELRSSSHREWDAVGGATRRGPQRRGARRALLRSTR